MEKCGDTRVSQIGEFCRQLLSIDFRLTENYRIAVLGVDESIDEIRTLYRRDLRFIHHPDNAYDCHTGMYGTGTEGLVVEEELAELASTYAIELPD